MNITTYTGLVGFLLALSTLSIPAANAANQPASPSIEGRLNRITAAIRQRESQLQDAAKPGANLLLAAGFGNGSRGGSFNQAGRFGTATTPGGGSFNNFNRSGGYGGAAGWRDGGGFVNGSSGGGAGFVNGAYGGAGFVNGAYGGAGFRNW